ncbi:hypothetical protein COO60DRAFT_508322 [Scenedesmus sp. NREL 46B-D3]|nr:hypothetical protein COO60DRAFT_508322 [Scenedesmus sp. NREL 46B-D3]
MQTSTRARGTCCPGPGFNATILALRNRRLFSNRSASSCQALHSAVSTWPHHAAQHLRRPAAAAAAARSNHTRPTTTTAAAASSTAAAADTANPCTGRAVVVGGGPAGLAAAIGLARQAGFRVDVFDARQNPAGDGNSSKEALLVALGSRGLQALTDLDIPLTPPTSSQGSRSSSPTLSTASSRGPSPTPAAVPGSDRGTVLGPAGHAAAAPRQQDLGAASGIATASYAEDASAITSLVGGVKPPTGLMLLQGMLLLGPGRMRRVEKYGRGAAAAGGGGAGLPVPAGIATP